MGLHESWSTKYRKKSQAKALKKALQEIKKQTRLQQQALDKKYDEQLVNENVDKQSLKSLEKDKLKMITEDGLNTLEYKVIERKELHKIVELIKVEI